MKGPPKLCVVKAQTLPGNSLPACRSVLFVLIVLHGASFWGLGALSPSVAQGQKVLWRRSLRCVKKHCARVFVRLVGGKSLCTL